MKKSLLLGLAFMLLAPMVAVAGHTAFDNMTELDEELATLTGQVGITINSSIEVTSGYVAWTDDDGEGIYTSPGLLLLDGFRMAGPGGLGAVDIIGLTIDCATSSSDTTYLVIGLPDIEGEISFEQICLGDTVANARGNSLGKLTIGNMKMSSSTLSISAH